MRGWATTFWNDEAGVVISAELVLILTIVVLGVIVGLVQVQHAVVAELNDIGLAVSHLNQSYGYTGFVGGRKWWGPTSWTAPSSFVDFYDGSTIGAYADVGAGFAGRGGFAAGMGYGYGYGYGYGAGGGAFAWETSFGTIVLRDGTLVPITLIASGTWSLPGGTILAATSANGSLLLLADGTTIPFVFGIAGVVEFADGSVFAVRPGARGTWVLSDGRIVTIALVEQVWTATLADGTRVTFRPANPAHVILANGTSVAVSAGAAGTLLLPDGRILNLNDAILPAGVEVGAVRTSSHGTIVLKDGILVPVQWNDAGTWSLPGGENLRPTAVNSSFLRLADGTTIPFLFGIAGIVELADGSVFAVRPGAEGTWVLSDGRGVTIAFVEETWTATLADGTRVTFRPANANHVILANGTVVEVKAGAAGTLLLPDGKALNLHDAVLPAGVTPEVAPMPGEIEAPIPPRGAVVPDGQGVLQHGVFAEGQPVPLMPAPMVPHGPLYGPQPHHRLPGPGYDDCPPVYRSERKQGRRWRQEIPQGPAPQNLPQL